MALYQFKLPDIGEGIAECEIAAWRVTTGQQVTEDQALVDMLTDKAAVEIPSPVAGVVVALRGAVGDKIAVGGVLVEIETDVAGDTAAAELTGQTNPAVSLPQTSGIPAPSAHSPADPQRDADRPQTSPAVRKRARELGIDLTHIRGSGPRGRIRLDDLPVAGGDTRHSTVDISPSPTPATTSDMESVRIVGLRRRIAETMQRTMQHVPHFSYVEELDVTELEGLRQHLNQQHGAARGKLTLLPFLIKALVQVRKDFPQINARYDDDAGVLHQHRAVHVGIATQTPQGLVVPVLRDAQQLDLWAMAAEIRRLAEAARSGKARRDELSGSTITITSLGPMGGITTTPVINAPEVAIVGVNKMVERPMIRNGSIVPRLMMNLSSSFDHRIVDGWDAARFIQAIRGRLEHPATLFID